jgi:hypothetical protein
MGVKGISWIEANFEKLIVAVMLLAFLAVLTFQFVLQSNTVEVGGSQVSLADAFRPAENAAERLKAELDNPEPDLPRDLQTRNLGDEFEDAISGGVVETDSFLSLGKPLAIDVNISEAHLAAGEYAPFIPPVPAAPRAASYRATLDPYAVSEIEGLAAFLPTEQPFDTPWVSVQSSFSGKALHDAYMNDPDGAGGAISALPGSWWNQGTGVLEVEIERQKRDVDGQWGAAEPVTRMPGITSLLDDLDERATNYKQLQQVGLQAVNQEQPILRPEFVPLLEGEPWVPPAEVPDPSEIGEIQSQLRVLERTLSSIDKNMEQKQRALSGPAPSSNAREDREDDRGGDEARRNAARQGQQSNRDDSGQKDVRKRNIERQIEQLTTRREGVVVELEALGWKQPENFGSDEAFDREKYTHEEELLEADEVHFWSHDFDVEAGATYRYRTRLVFVNPMYGRKSSLDESLHELADAKLTRSEWTQWGVPVSVSWDEYYFLTGASAGSSSFGSASANAELYRFYYGYWRKSEVGLQPGDQFVSEITLPEGLQRWDVEKPAEEQAWKPEIEGAEEEVEQADGVAELLLPTDLVIEADSWLLDVIQSPVVTAGIGGQAQASLEALVRGPDGQISSRSHRVDQSLPLYSIIKASSEIGEEQLPRIPGQTARRPIGGNLDFIDGRGLDDRQIEEERRRRERDAGGGGGAGGG